MISFFFFKQKTAYEMRISDWSSDVCSSDLAAWSVSADCTTGYRHISQAWRDRHGGGEGGECFPGLLAPSRNDCNRVLPGRIFHYRGFGSHRRAWLYSSRRAQQGSYYLRRLQHLPERNRIGDKSFARSG